jgi:MFS family permease
MFSPLRHAAYRHLFLAQVAALLGTGMATVALSLLAHDLAGASAGQILGAALAIKMVAYIGVAPFASALADPCPTFAVGPFRPARTPATNGLSGAVSHVINSRSEGCQSGHQGLSSTSPQEFVSVCTVPW